jgi:hypothetical protein
LAASTYQQTKSGNLFPITPASLAGNAFFGRLVSLYMFVCLPFRPSFRMEQIGSYCTDSQRNSNKCNSVSTFLFHIYMKLNMFWATHRPSLGA